MRTSIGGEPTKPIAHRGGRASVPVPPSITSELVTADPHAARVPVGGPAAIALGRRTCPAALFTPGPHPGIADAREACLDRTSAAGGLPVPWSQSEIGGYVDYCRQRVRDTLTAMTEQKAAALLPPSAPLRGCSAGRYRVLALEASEKGLALGAAEDNGSGGRGRLADLDDHLGIRDQVVGPVRMVRCAGAGRDDDIAVVVEEIGERPGSRDAGLGAGRGEQEQLGIAEVPADAPCVGSELGHQGAVGVIRVAIGLRDRQALPAIRSGWSCSAMRA